MLLCAGDAADTVKVTGDTLLPAEDYTALVHSAVVVKEAAMPAKVCFGDVVLAASACVCIGVCFCLLLFDVRQGGALFAKNQQLLVWSGGRFEIKDYQP